MAALYASWDRLSQPLDNAISAGLSHLGFDMVTKDPLTSSWPLINKPSEPLLLISAYLCVVLTWRSLLVAKRSQTGKATSAPAKASAFEFTPTNLVVVSHNLFLTALSVYMCVGCFSEAIANNYSLFGNAYSPKQTRMAWYVYVFYVSKFLEFADTLIMLWKGNVQQVSLLHVYHHASIAPIWWIIARSAPGGEAYWSAGLNSLVHVIMYSYYCAAALKVDKKYLGWAKYLTQFQMAQFASNMVQSSYDVLFPGAYNSALVHLLFFYMISLLILFGSFYRKRYQSSKDKRP